MANIKGYAGPERREHERQNYEPDQRPAIWIGDNEYKVVNISKGGLRIVIKNENQGTPLGKAWVQGKISFSNGETIDIAGKIVWMIDNEIGLKLKELIPSSIIEKEKRRMNA